MPMTWEEWRTALSEEFKRRWGFTLDEYSGPDNDDCWKEMFEDGLTPREAADEEASAAEH